MDQYLVLYWMNGTPAWYRCNAANDDAACLHTSGYMLGVLRERGEKTVGPEFNVFRFQAGRGYASFLRNASIKGPWGYPEIEWTDGFNEKAAADEMFLALEAGRANDPAASEPPGGEDPQKDDARLPDIKKAVVSVEDDKD